MVLSILVTLTVTEFTEYSEQAFDIRAYAQLKGAHTAVVNWFIDHTADGLSCTSVELATNGVIFGDSSILRGFQHDEGARVAMTIIIRWKDFMISYLILLFSIIVDIF